MIEWVKEAVFLQSISLTKGGIGEVFDFLEQSGFLSYALPFLMIFALVFGILSRMGIFKDKGINAVLALTVGFISLQFGFVPQFFSQIFPRFGVGLAIVLVLLILGGLFFDPKNKGLMIGLGVASLIIVGVVLFQTANSLGWWNAGSGAFLQDNLGVILGVLVVLGLIIVVIVGGIPKMSNDPSESILTRALLGKKD